MRSLEDGGGRGESASSYTVGTVAAMLGIPVATLRSWNQRYGLGPAHRRPGSHRYYTAGDVAMLSRMADLVSAGASPAKAAQAARIAADSVPAPGDVAPVLRAAEQLRVAELLGLITAHLTHFGVVATWRELCRPVFADIVSRQDGGIGLVDVEHVVSGAITTGLHRAVPAVRAVSGFAPVLLACAPGEEHVLPLEVLRAALAEVGVPAVLLGAAVPAGALADAVAKAGDPVVVLWSQTARTAAVVPVQAGVGEPARLLLAGPGWPEAPGMQRLGSLEEAVAEVGRLARSR
ncbi:MerR family transcriptional regulator [Nocardia alba]|uniref:MerR family transcriptional regulator n=1 Tax=Nocardia alba TaxID=225051 RepID=UPI000ADBC676|nr:MerR family transcriptional regulator [Nocardia alba]